HAEAGRSGTAFLISSACRGVHRRGKGRHGPGDHQELASADPVQVRFSKNMANSGDLYTRDETAWLDVMARLIAERRFGELDYEHLHEFLTDMARRDRREVLSRLTAL